MHNQQKLPFLDLVTPHQELEGELTAVFQKALRSAGFIGGPMVDEFEREFAEFCETRHCVGLGSGTDAVRFALMAAGVQPGDIVITVPHTFIATTEAITQAGARADFVDIDEQTYCMDPEKLREYFVRECYLERETGTAFHRKLQAPVTAVVPVHLYGQTADMDADPGNCEALQPDCGGGRLPGAWGGIFFKEREPLEKSRAPWDRRRRSASIPARISERAAKPAR